MKYRNKRRIIFILTCIFLVCIVFFVIYTTKKSEKYIYAYSTLNEEKNNLKISNAKKIDINEIIQKNLLKHNYKEEINVEEKELEYITKYRNSNDLYIGETRISQEGRKGIQEITTKIVLDRNDRIIKQEQVSAVVVKSSINKIIEIGVKKKEQKNKKIKSDSLNFDIAINKPSGFTLNQFMKALTDSKDINKTFEQNAKYFYYIEKEYKINGIFVAAVGIHESNWGKSKIALDKKNLFGYGAYDSNPYNGAYSFETYSESIDLIARVFVKYYLNPKGTKIYGGEIANGAYYSGNTISDINKRYASDKNWANGVYLHMKYLYNKIN